MPDNLERLLADLGRAPVDRSLEGVTSELSQRLAETRAANVQTWSIRGLAALVVATTGVLASSAMPAMAAAEASPFAAWSTLAPSTLLH